MFPFEFDKEDRPWFATFAAIALLQAIGVFVVVWNTSGGHFMLPLDDSYIHLQYARQFAGDAPLVYTRGAAPSGGMTSPFYVLMLMPLFLAGLSGVKGALASYVIGSVLWMLSPIWAYQIIKRLANGLAAAVGGGLLLANGHLMWNFLSGMETGVYTALLIGAVLAAAVWWRHEKRHARVLLVAIAAVLPLVRPEGLILPVLLIGMLLVRRGQEPRLSLLTMLAAMIPFAIWLLVLRAATGDWRPAGLVAKGLASYPLLDWPQKFGIAGNTLAAIPRLYMNTIPGADYAAFKGTSTMPYVPAGLGVMSLFGAGLLIAGEWRSRRTGAGTLLALLWILGLASLAASRFPFIHQQRYLAPYTALAIVLAMVTLWRFGQLFHQHEEMAVKGAGLGLLVASLPSVVFWTAEYGRNSRDIFHMLRVSSFGLERETRPVAITDAGVLAYYTNTPLVDLVGLGSQEFTRPVQNGEGTILEALSDLPTARRPVALLSYPSWWSPEFPLGEAEWSTAIPRTSITSGTLMSFMPIDWSSIELGDAPPVSPGRRILLTVDVADLSSEQDSRYTMQVGLYDVDDRAWPQPLCPVGSVEMPEVTATEPGTTRTLVLFAGGIATDGGRVVRGESFEFHPARFPKGDVHLRARVGAPPDSERFFPAAAKIVVSATSNTTGYRAQRVFDLDESPEVELVDYDFDLGTLFDEAGGGNWRIDINSLPSGAAWASYHYWITDAPPELAENQITKD